MKCIVIESNPDQTNARPVADESGAPVIYASMTEARAELKANGYSYNRANRRYYIADAPEYRAYIVREDSEEYAEIMEQTEQAAEPDPEPVNDWTREDWIMWFEHWTHEDAENARDCMEEAAYMLEVVAEDAANEDTARLAEDVNRVCLYATYTSEAAHAAAEEAKQAGTAAAAEDAKKAAEYAAQADKYAANAHATRYARMRWATWSRENIAAYLGDVTAYDVSAIIEDMHDTGDSLEDVAERHQVVTFWPAA